MTEGLKTLIDSIGTWVNGRIATVSINTDEIRNLEHGILHKFNLGNADNIMYNKAILMDSKGDTRKVDVLSMKMISVNYAVAYIHDPDIDVFPSVTYYVKKPLFGDPSIYSQVYTDEECTQKATGLTVGDWSNEYVAMQSDIDKVMMMSHGILHALQGKTIPTSATIYTNETLNDTYHADVIGYFLVGEGEEAETIIILHFSLIEDMNNGICYAYYEEKEGRTPYIYSDKELTQTINLGEGKFKVKNFVDTTIASSIKTLDTNIGTTSDSTTKNTVFGKLANILDKVSNISFDKSDLAKETTLTSWINGAWSTLSLSITNFITYVKNNIAHKSDIPHTIDPQMLIRLLCQDEEADNMIAADNDWWFRTGRYKVISGTRMAEWVRPYGDHTEYAYSSTSNQPDKLIKADGTDWWNVEGRETLKLVTTQDLPEDYAKKSDIPTNYAKQGSNTNTSLTSLDSDVNILKLFEHGILHKLNRDSSTNLSYNKARLRMTVNNEDTYYDVDVLHIKLNSNLQYIAYLHCTNAEMFGQLYYSKVTDFNSYSQVYSDESCTQIINGTTVGNWSNEHIATDTDINEEKLLSHGILHAIQGGAYPISATVYQEGYEADSVHADIVSKYMRDDGYDNIVLHIADAEYIGNNGFFYAEYSNPNNPYIYYDKELTNKVIEDNIPYKIKDFKSETIVNRLSNIRADISLLSSSVAKKSEVDSAISALSTKIGTLSTKIDNLSTLITAMSSVNEYTVASAINELNNRIDNVQSDVDTTDAVASNPLLMSANNLI